MVVYTPPVSRWPPRGGLDSEFPSPRTLARDRLGLALSGRYARQFGPSRLIGYSQLTYTCAYSCTHTGIYMHTHIHTYTCIQKNIHTYTWIHIYIHMHAYTITHIDTYTCIHICIHVHAYTYTYIYMHTLIHAYTYTYIYCINVCTHIYTAIGPPAISHLLTRK